MKPGIYFFLLLICFLFAFTTHAQLTIYGGPQLTSARYLIHGVKQETEHKTGFMAGVGLKTLIEGPAYFSPMIFFSRKGYKVKLDRPSFPPDSGAVNNNTSINTIELAPLVQINLSQKENYFFLRFGPSFDFNLSGTEEFDSTDNKHITQDMKFDFGTYSHATVIMNAQLGYQHKGGLSIFAHYGYGIGSFNNADFGPKIFHRVGGVSLAWTFKKKP